MAEKPILFNTEMVRAILEGRKTVTRRVVKGPYYIDDEQASRVSGLAMHKGTNITHGMPYEDQLFSPGDILWVRETWFYERHMESIQEEKPDLPSGRYSFRYVYRADNPDYPVKFGAYAGGWCPSIFMPREAARIFLRVTDVRVERLQTSFFEPICPIFAVQAEGIDIGDTCRECIENYGEPCCVDTVDEDGSDLYGGECGELDQSRGEFSDLWDSTIKPADRDRYGWAANPFCWVIAFERTERSVTPT